jgi:hypothetical protein
MTFSIGDIVRIKGTDKYGVIKKLIKSRWSTAHNPDCRQAQIEWITIKEYNHTIVTRDPTAYHLTMYLEKIE